MFRNLRTGTKLILLCSAFIISIVVTTYALVAEKQIAIDVARKELAGSRYLAAVRDVYAGILTGSVPRTTSPDDVLKMLAAAQADAPDQLQTADFEQELAGALRLLQWSQTEDAKVDFLVLDALAKARRLALRVGEESTLVLDPQLDSYYLQNVIGAKRRRCSAAPPRRRPRPSAGCASSSSMACCGRLRRKWGTISAGRIAGIPTAACGRPSPTNFRR
jgi:hypothetical protein